MVGLNILSLQFFNICNLQSVSTIFFINIKMQHLSYILNHIVAYLRLLHRSEIHENLKCSRCNKDGNSLLGGNDFDLAATEHKPSMPGVQDYIDIGGFGEISGCLQIMDSSHHQVSFVEILFVCYLTLHYGSSFEAQ